MSVISPGGHHGPLHRPRRLITGGASSIGRATALRLAAEGATVVADVQDERAAAVVTEVETAGGTAHAGYREVVEVTSDSVFLGQKAASAALHASGNGAVVNTSSVFGIVGGFGGGPGYAAAEGAVSTLTKNTALGWATEGVRVNSVHPGIIDAPFVTGAELVVDGGYVAR